MTTTKTLRRFLLAGSIVAGLTGFGVAAPAGAAPPPDFDFELDPGFTPPDLCIHVACPDLDPGLGIDLPCEVLPLGCLDEVPGDTDETPDETPEDTPDETPEDTPDDIPEETPEDTPDDTPEDTPEETEVEVQPAEVDRAIVGNPNFTG